MTTPSKTRRQSRSKAARKDFPAQPVSITVDSETSPLAAEFREIEQFMAISGKFHLLEVAGKMTLMPRVPLAIDCDDDGYGWTSGGLF